MYLWIDLFTSFCKFIEEFTVLTLKELYKLSITFTDVNFTFVSLLLTFTSYNVNSNSYENILREAAKKNGFKKVGFSEEEINKILGNNWFNFYKGMN